MALKMVITDQLYLVKQSTGKPKTPACNCNSKSDSQIKSLIELIHYLKQENKLKNSFIQSLPLHNSCTRSSHPRCFLKNVLRNFAKSTRKHLCQSVFFNKVVGLRPATLLKKETLAQAFSCQFNKISRITFFTEHLWGTASSLPLALMIYFAIMIKLMKTLQLLVMTIYLMILKVQRMRITTQMEKYNSQEE